MKKLPMTSKEVLEIFKNSGAMLTGHFLLSSGRHSQVYFEKFQVLQYPKYLEQVCRALADHYRNTPIDIVIGPTTGGMLIAYEVARQLGKRFVFAEPNEKGDARVLKRGFTLSVKDRVLIVDDVLTTGKSVREVIELVNICGASIVGLGLLLDRSETPINLGIEMFALARVTATSFAAEECPLCQQGQSITKPGSRPIIADLAG